MIQTKVEDIFLGLTFEETHLLASEGNTSLRSYTHVEDFLAFSLLTAKITLALRKPTSN